MSTEPWDCKVDGHELEQRGEYDPDTGCYPYMQCIYCGHEEPWVGGTDYIDGDFA